MRVSWLYVALGAAAALGAWVLFVGLPRWYPPDSPPTAAPTGMPTDGEHVDATLFYVSDDGMRLVGFERRLERQVALDAQARIVIEAQLAEPPVPLLSPIPPGTQLLSLYLTELGEAFVDPERDPPADERPRDDVERELVRQFVGD